MSAVHNHPPYEPVCNERPVGACMVTLDPESREQVERLVRAVNYAGSEDQFTDRMQAALRTLVAAPKPEEPTGLGAVVEDVHGRRYQRVERDRAAWLRSDVAIEAALDWRDYGQISAVRVLSEGVTP